MDLRVGLGLPAIHDLQPWHVLSLVSPRHAGVLNGTDPCLRRGWKRRITTCGHGFEWVRWSS
jgi:hypothetical protein